MEIYEVRWSHDSSDKRMVAVPDGDGFRYASEWATKMCKEILEEMKDGLSKKEQAEVEKPQVCDVVFQYHVDRTYKLKVTAI